MRATSALAADRPVKPNSAATSDTTSMISAHFKRDMGSPFRPVECADPGLGSLPPESPLDRTIYLLYIFLTLLDRGRLRRRSKAERGAASACRASQARPSGGDGDPPGGTTTPATGSPISRGTP